MSERYSGGLITKSPITPTGPFETGAASGVWTLEQQMQFKQQGIWPLAGNAVPYIEDMFSTYLYTGTGAALTITNGIDLSTKGGLVWTKQRSLSANHALIDTVRGRANVLYSNLTDAQIASSAGRDISTFDTTGYTLGTNQQAVLNSSAETYVSWTFREQPKFFDIVTYSGNATNRTIAHNLGSVPGCIIIKRISSPAAWQVYHRSLANTQYMVLNTTAAVATGATRWNSTTATSTVFSLGTDITVNDSSENYIAYIFAHDAGGFGLTGTDNVISCGTFTCDGSGTASVTLGYEPQWIMFKKTDATGNWWMFDNMRGLPAYNTAGDQVLYANLTNAEVSGGTTASTNATGFAGIGLGASATFIYVAIRRGPMKVPTVGTSVFYPTTYTGPALGTTSTVTTGWPVDSIWCGVKNYAGSAKTLIQDRLRIANNTTTSNTLQTTSTDSETVLNTYVTFNIANNTGYTINDTNGSWNGDSSGGYNPYAWVFRRAPSFFDEVCYTGTGVAKTEAHNLGVVPELMIVKQRNTARDWAVYTSATAATNFMYLNSTVASGASSSMWNDTTPTSSVFTVGTNLRTNVSAGTYVAYLFATCAGISKVGSYTGTGALQTVNCGFTSGARFVLIKRTDTTGDWWTYDSARGITSGNDPYLFLNSTAAEVTSTNYVDTDTTGFKVTAAAPAGLNASGGTYIFLAIA
jgi:hypothetical protein